jgi:hypothetical protein
MSALKERKVEVVPVEVSYTVFKNSKSFTPGISGIDWKAKKIQFFAL